jgi:hypothetical protein
LTTDRSHKNRAIDPVNINVREKSPLKSKERLTFGIVSSRLEDKD